MPNKSAKYSEESTLTNTKYLSLRFGIYFGAKLNTEESMMIEQIETKLGRMYYDSEYQEPAQAVPSVTTVIGDISEGSDANSGLINWNVNLAVEAIKPHLQHTGTRNIWQYEGRKGDLRMIADLHRNEVKQRHLSVGEDFHHYAATGERRYGSDSLANRWLATACESWDEFIADNEDLYAPEYYERRVLGPGGYGGTVDAVGMFGQDRMVFEFKTSRRILAVHAIQAAAYAAALDIPMAAVVRFGKYSSEYEIQYVNVPEGLKAFMHMLEAWKAINQNWSRMYLDLEELILEEEKYA